MLQVARIARLSTLPTDYDKESVELHAQLHGKLDVRSKVSLASKHDLSLAYTPGVGQVCVEIARAPERVFDLTIKHNTVAVVSDGSAILGLGNLGAEAAIPVMEGKAVLFKEFAGVDAFPICLATQDVDEIVAIVRAIAPCSAASTSKTSPRRAASRSRRGCRISASRCSTTTSTAPPSSSVAALLNALKVTGKNLDRVHDRVQRQRRRGDRLRQLILSYGELGHVPEAGDIILCDSKGIVDRDAHRPEPLQARDRRDARTGAN